MSTRVFKTPKTMFVLKIENLATLNYRSENCRQYAFI